MITRYVIPVIAAVGLIGGILFTFEMGREKERPTGMIAEPPASTYSSNISGTGIIEASSRNIEVGSFLSGVVAKVFVTEGDSVKAGDPLFMLDDRSAKAEAGQARIILADEEDKLAQLKGQKVGFSVSKDRMKRQDFAAILAKNKLEQAEITLSKMTVASPIDGKVLKVRVREGEFVTASASQQPVLVGNDNPMHLRVAIDENDVWRFSSSAKAKAALRSNKDIAIDLSFVRVEPYVMPKQNLSGASIERVDTRVLEVIYKIEPNDKPLYIGQIMDVFIEAPSQSLAPSP